MATSPLSARLSSSIAGEDTEHFKSRADEKLEEAQYVENVPHGRYISSIEIQARFPTLRHLNEGQMIELNNEVRSIIDWRMMPAVTLMFLMK